MNQRSKRCGHANVNRMNEVPRGATRPAAVVVIILCVGFAVAMVAISSCRKLPSEQEMQRTQPNTAGQTEIPEPEAVQTQIPEPEANSGNSPPDRAVWLDPSTATPLSQTNPAARQLMDDHVNSPASVQGSPTPVQEDHSYTFSHHLDAETTTFEAANPETKVPGRMTVTLTGDFRGKRLSDGQPDVGSHLEGHAEATFSFVPYDRYSPSYSATVKTLQVAGDSTNNSIFFDFGLETTGSDGSSLQFMLREVAIVTEDGAQVTFRQLK